MNAQSFWCGGLLVGLDGWATDACRGDATGGCSAGSGFESRRYSLPVRQTFRHEKDRVAWCVVRAGRSNCGVTPDAVQLPHAMGNLRTKSKDNPICAESRGSLPGATFPPGTGRLGNCMPLNESPVNPSSDLTGESQAAHTLPELVLEVSRGRTRFPQRPVTGPRFLIGSAITCDLRLGGGDIPAVHTLIVRSEQGYELETLVGEPPLKVNGEIVQQAWLRDGDRIEIGSIELAARLVASAGLSTDPLATDRPPLDQMTTAELVDFIELEQDLQARQELSRHAGAAALLREARRLSTKPVQVKPLPGTRIDRGESEIPRPHTAPRVPVVELKPQVVESTEAHALGEQMAALSQELRLTLEAAGQREGQYAQSLADLLLVQQRLARQLADVTDTVDQLRQTQETRSYETPRPRVSA